MTLAEITDSTDLDFLEMLAKYFEAIPTEEWTINQRHIYRNGINTYCAYGQLDRINEAIGVPTPNYANGITGDRLMKLSQKYIGRDILWRQPCIIAEANNGRLEEYGQETPKERSIAALQDLIKAYKAANN